MAAVGSALWLQRGQQWSRKLVPLEPAVPEKKILTEILPKQLK